MDTVSHFNCHVFVHLIRFIASESYIYVLSASFRSGLMTPLCKHNDKQEELRQSGNRVLRSNTILCMFCYFLRGCKKDVVVFKNVCSCLAFHV